MDGGYDFLRLMKVTKAFLLLPSPCPGQHMWAGAGVEEPLGPGSGFTVYPQGPQDLRKTGSPKPLPVSYFPGIAPTAHV